MSVAPQASDDMTVQPLLSLRKRRKIRYIIREWFVPDFIVAQIGTAFTVYSLATKGVVELRWLVAIVAFLTATLLAAAVSWVLGSIAWKQLDGELSRTPDEDDLT
jgi:hypothetical protein